MENGTRQPVEASALIEAHIPIGDATHDLYLYQEAIGEGITHYALLNGHRVRPEPNVRPCQQGSIRWFEDIVMLFHEVRVRENTPRD